MDMKQMKCSRWLGLVFLFTLWLLLVTFALLLSATVHPTIAAVLLAVGISGVVAAILVSLVERFVR